MNKNWKAWVFTKAEPLLWRRSTPLPLKELAWRAVRFAVKCGRSHPVSFALRPVVMYKNLKRLVGINLVLVAMAAVMWGPIPSLAADVGGVPVIVLPEGQPPLATQEAVVNPLPHVEVSQKFWLLHAGVDLRTPIGTPVNPIMKGLVVETELSRMGYGQKVIIAHRNGYKSLYAHLSKIVAKVGQEVSTETVIGLSGSSGRSTGPHLHLEIHQDGKPINPAPILGLK